MNLQKYLRNIALLLSATFALTACDGMIYDDEGDCDPYYKVRFVYENNLKFTDAFHNEVFEVTLYAVDPASGQIVWQKHESGDELRRQGYLMDVDIDPGRYTLIAWCGEGHKTSFSVADATVHTGLRCRLDDRTSLGDGTATVSNELKRLYHGKEENVEFEDEQGTHIKTVYLTKDTNAVHIVLQQLSGESIDHRDFTFTIEGENGFMDWDNSLLPDEKLVYMPHDTYSGIAGVDVPDYTDDSDAPAGRAIIQVGAAVAHHTVSRLVKGQDVRVKIYNKSTGDCIVSVPLIDYALLVKGKYNRPDGKPLTDQEYLDYQDDYSMVFFLDDGMRWINTDIYINSWHVVLQDTDL